MEGGVQKAKKKKIALEANNKKEFALIYGQCSPKLVSKIKGSNLWERANKEQDVVQLLKIIRGYCCEVDKHQQSTWGLASQRSIRSRDSP